MIEFYSLNPDLTHDVPILPANKVYPDWLKNLTHKPSLKTCPGVINFYKRGYIMRAWTDIQIQIISNNVFFYNCTDNITSLGSHSRDQYANFYEDHIHVKIISPWKIKSNSRTSVMALEPTWNYPNPFFRMVPGIADLDENTELPTNPQIFFPVKQDPYMIRINKFDPLLYFLEVFAVD